MAKTPAEIPFARELTKTLEQLVVQRVYLMRPNFPVLAAQRTNRVTNLFCLTKKVRKDSTLFDRELWRNVVALAVHVRAIECDGLNGLHGASYPI
jgi:hypothetical protein